MSSPQTPGRPNSGVNAAMVVKTPKTTGTSTCRTPRTAAAADARFRALDTPLDILPDDDRVVHDDAQREDEGEQADHVHADGKSGHEQEGAEEGHREPRGGPHREPAREREEQHQEDQGEPREAVPDEHRHPAFEEPPNC